MRQSGEGEGCAPETELSLRKPLLNHLPVSWLEAPNLSTAGTVRLPRGNWIFSPRPTGWLYTFRSPELSALAHARGVWSRFPGPER